MNITTKEYERILNSAPADHHSERFLKFLRNNNVVVLETPEWLVIENVKYHTDDTPWYTAFDKGKDFILEYKLQLLQWEFPEYRYMFNSVYAKTIKRFHVHLFRVDTQYIIEPQ